MQERINAIFQLWQDHPGAGGQVLVIHEGRVLFEKCYGYANIETQTPITTDSIFHVASVTKQFTAMCVLILHERGLLNVYDDVRKYIPDLIRFSEPLTIKQMLNHTSGLRGYYEMMYLGGRSAEDHYAQHEVRRLVGRQKVLNFAPGTEYLYTNANFMLAATIVERLSGMTLNDFAAENIFNPLGMEHSFIRDNARMIIPNKVSSYHDNGYEFTNAILTFGLYGGTSLHTNCRELTKFLQQYREPTLISRETMENIMLNIPEIGGKKGNYGTGVFISDLEGHRHIHHAGVNAGFRAVGQIYPEDDLIIAICANNYNTPVEYAARDIARIVLGLPERVKPTLEPWARDTVCLDNVSGTYYCDKNKTLYDLQVRDGKLYMDGVYMTPEKGNIFRQGWRNIRLAIGPEIVRQGGPHVVHLRKLEEQPEQDCMAACVGEYYCDDVQGHFEVALEDGKLWVKHLRFQPKRLHWMGGDEFVYDKYRIRFLRDARDAVTGYLFNSDHLRNVEFVKVR